MKLNAEQIIKALECCASEAQMCKDCLMPEEVKDDCRCMETISRNALALIKQLTEENERLKKTLIDEPIVISIPPLCKEHIDRLKNARISIFEDDATAKVKADTVRKLVEIIKTNYAVSKVHYAKDAEPVITYALTNYQLDQIAKEMLEGKDEP